MERESIAAAPVIRRINTATVLYGVGEIAFVNSYMLLYFKTLGIAADRILLYLAVPMLLRFVTLLPFANYTERHGIVRTGVFGLSVSSLSFIILALAGFLHGTALEAVVLLGVILYGAGYSFYLGAWYPMLSSKIPKGMRGAFFGRMRLLYQSAAICFTFLVTSIIGTYPPTQVFQLSLIVIFLLRTVGIMVYASIPECERTGGAAPGLRASLAAVFTHANYMGFAAYAFLLFLFTGAGVSIFGLLAKDTLMLGDAKVMLLGNLVTVGALMGFVLGGLSVDRIGTKAVFLLCHFSYAAIMLAFLARFFAPLPAMYTLGFLFLAFGMVQSASGVALSSEMLGIMPSENKVVASALYLSLTSLGVALSGIFSSLILKLRMLAQSWPLLGCQMGPYDSLIAFYGVMTLVLVVTLGLVPSVVRKADVEVN